MRARQRSNLNCMLQTELPQAQIERIAPHIYGAKSARTRTTTLSLLLTILVSSLLLVGCGVNVTDRTPPPTATVPRSPNVSDAPNTQETHDLAIAAVDFDPALDPQQFVMGRPYSLLVAVENKGNRKEGPFTVSAQLLTSDRQTTLLSQQKSVTVLAAGDMTVVRFPSANTVPRQRSYFLNIQIGSVPYETNTSNNKRTLEIQISVGN